MWGVGTRTKETETNIKVHIWEMWEMVVSERDEKAIWTKVGGIYLSWKFLYPSYQILIEFVLMEAIENPSELNDVGTK